MKLPDRAPFSYRDDPNVPEFDDRGLRTVMDAQCGLCARGARWIARNDHARAFRIIPMQTDLGRALFQHYDLDPEDPASWLFLDQGQGYTSLDAIIRVGRHLGGASKLLSALRVLPRPVQDALYGAIARNRYRLSPRVDMCTLPDADIQARLLI